MAFMFGQSTRGKLTVIFRNFEYVKECDNVSGKISWRCRFNKKFKCKAHLVTLGDRVIDDKQPEHVHEGNINLFRRQIHRQSIQSTQKSKSANEEIKMNTAIDAIKHIVCLII